MAPICAQQPTVTQVSTMVLAPDIGAEIDEARHQHGVAGDEGGMAHDRAGHGAKAGLAEAVLAPAGEFRGDLVPPGRAAGAALDDGVVAKPERQQHRLFQPLVDLPRRRPLGALDFLRHAGVAGIEHFQGFADGVADIAVGVGVDMGAVVEGAFDKGLQFGHARTGKGKGGGSIRCGGAIVNARMGAGPQRTRGPKPISATAVSGSLAGRKRSL